MIDDPGEVVLSLDDGASAAGCVSLDANTASCPQSAIASFVDVGERGQGSGKPGIVRFDIRRAPNEHVAFGGGGPPLLSGRARAVDRSPRSR